MGLFGKSKKERVKELMDSGLQFIKESGSGLNDAIECFSKVLDLDPNNQLALYQLGKAWSRKEKYENAIQCFEKAIQLKHDTQILSELDPNDNSIAISLCECFVKIKNFDKLKIYTLKILSNKPDEDHLLSLNSLFFEEKMLWEGLKIYDSFLEKNPQDRLLWEIRGIFTFLFEGYIESINSFEKVIQLDPPGNQLCNSLLLRSRAYEDSFQKIEKKIIFEESERILGKWRIILNYNALRGTELKFYRMLVITNEKLIFLKQQPGSDSGDIVMMKLGYGNFPETNSDFFPKIDIITILPLEDIISFTNNNNCCEIQYYQEKNKIGRIDFKLNKPDFEFNLNIEDIIKKKKNKNSLKIIDFSSIKEYLKNGGVVMQTFKCPGCGGSLEFPEKTDITTCQYCGNKIKAVDLFERIKSIL